MDMMSAAMNQANANESEFPRLCIEVGLSCQSCTRETARQTAAVCKGLRGKAVGQLFVQLYPNSACSSMHSHFAACYQEASMELNQVEMNRVDDLDTLEPIAIPEPAFERREVMYARPRAMAAVA
jgi:hypothetical protein